MAAPADYWLQLAYAAHRGCSLHEREPLIFGPTATRLTVSDAPCAASLALRTSCNLKTNLTLLAGENYETGARRVAIVGRLYTLRDGGDAMAKTNQVSRRSPLAFRLWVQ